MIALDPTLCHAILRARDARHDGRFFTGVTTTGIYCRPICPAPTPKAENCRFFALAAQAQDAGFRPCLRCRPEVAPHTPAWRGTQASVTRAMALIEDGALDTGGLDDLAARVGLGARHLRRLFDRHLGVGPLGLARTRRVHLAKQLITETRLGLADIALAAGFGSVRRFNATFQALYGKPPGALRRQAGAEAPAASGLQVRVPVRMPYDWDAMAAHLAARAIPGLEVATSDAYARAFALSRPDGAEARGAVRVTRVRDGRGGVDQLQVAVTIDRIAALPDVLARVGHLFDVAADPEAIGAHLSADPALAPLIARRPGLRLPGAWDGFETGVRAILGQQVTVAAGRRLCGALLAALGRPGPALDGRASLLFPDAETLASADLAFMPMPQARARALQAFARAVRDDPGLLDPAREPEATMRDLLAVPGIGPWTAGYVALRALRHADALPAGDAALRQAVGRLWPHVATGDRDAHLARVSQGWRPWRAHAVQHLWAMEADPRPAPETAVEEEAPCCA
jgi:AraC family transcriptional regulator of adaptative response / DNA-3-methyladenine glycosylase II